MRRSGNHSRRNFSKSRGRPRNFHASSLNHQKSSSNFHSNYSNIDSTTSEKIIEVLNKSFPNDVQFKNLIRSFQVNYPVSNIRKVLYHLQSQGVVQNTSHKPDKWVLLRRISPNTSVVDDHSQCKESGIQPSRNDFDADFSDIPPLSDHDNNPSTSSNDILKPDSLSRNATILPQTSNEMEVESLSSSSATSSINTRNLSIKDKLLVALHSCKEVPTSKLVNDFKGVYSKKHINQTLYSLQDLGLVDRCLENPPKWRLMAKGNDYFKSIEDSTKTSCKRKQDSSDYVGQMQAVSLSADNKQHSQMAPPHKIPRISSGHYFKDDFGSSDKNPISQLMEYAQARNVKPDFQTSQSGPDHKRRFSVTIKMGGETYSPVEGGSKKEAKTLACAHLLKILQQSTEISSQHNPLVSAPIQMQPARVPPLPLNISSSNKNAISLINEYAQANSLNIEFSTDSHGPEHRKNFRTILKLGNQTFQPVYAPSKKESKLKAAEVGLVILQESGKIARAGELESGQASNIVTYHDRVANLVNMKFHSLLSDLPDTVVGRKILAGFVMSQTFYTEHGEEKQWSVISIGSGNRCVAGDKLSLQGDTVNDCHAEIIARRGLMRYFYDQIASFRSNSEEEENILQISQQNPSKLEVKPGVRFHLYISTAPCGDSALFAKSDTGPDAGDGSDTNGHCPLFDNKKQGILRTKVENGEGCIPIDEDANVPTWDGLLRGERLRTMSCSDKLAKWNFLGLQGSLLSHFLEPVYMSSLTLGMLYHHGHLTRAVCCRVEKYLNLLAPTDISLPFKLNHPEVAKVSGDDPSRDTGKMKTREYSLNWCSGDERAEVLDGTKGRCEARYGCLQEVSQVSKSSLYHHFKKLSTTNYPNYAKAKEAVTEYRTACAMMKEAFEKAERGTWMSKPSEVEDF